MSSILDLKQLSAYGLSVQALQKYFTQTSSAPFAAFPQAYQYTSKTQTAFGKTQHHQYKYTGYPNAYAVPTSGLDWSANQGPSAVSNVQKFLDKDAKTLQYFWNWTKGGNAKNNPMVVNGPQYYNTPVPQYSYIVKWDGALETNTLSIKNFLGAQLATSGFTNIDTSSLTSYGWRNGASTGTTPTVNFSTDVQGLPGATENSNFTPTAIPFVQGEPKYNLSFSSVVSSAPQTYTFGGQFTSSVTTSNTQGSSTSSTTGGDNSWGISGTIAYTPPKDSGGISLSATAQSSYEQSWQQVNNVDFSQTSETTTGQAIQVGFSMVIGGNNTDSTPIQSLGSSGDAGINKSYVYEIGEDYTIAVLAYNASVPSSIHTDWMYTGPVSNVTFTPTYWNQGTPALPVPTVPTKWPSQGGTQTGITTPSSTTSSDYIGYIGQWAWDYNFDSVVMGSSDYYPMIQVVDDQLVVLGASTATSQLGYSFYLSQTSSHWSNAQPTVSRQAAQFAQAEPSEMHAGGEYLKTAVDLPGNIVNHKNIHQQRVDAAKSQGNPYNFMGHRIDSRHDQPGTLHLLSPEPDVVKLDESQNDHVIISHGKHDKISTGFGRDVVDLSGGEGSSSAYTGEGDDLIYVIDNDYVEAGNGDDTIVASGGASVFSGEGKDDIAIKSGAGAVIADFAPGTDQLSQYFTPGSSVISDPAGLNLSSIDRSRGKSFHVWSASGEHSAILHLEDDSVLTNPDARLNLALRDQDLLAELISSHQRTDTPNEFRAKLSAFMGDAVQKFLTVGFEDRNYYYQDTVSGKQEYQQALINLLSIDYDPQSASAAVNEAMSGTDWNNPLAWQMVYDTAADNLFGSYVPPATLSLNAVSANKVEGDIGSKEFIFNVSRAGDPSLPVSLTWAVTPSGDHPVDALDFAGGRLPGGILELAAGQASQQIILNVVGDNTFEFDEAFTVSLTAPSSGANLLNGASSAVGQIRNDDQATPSYSFWASPPNAIYEGSSFAVNMSTANVPAGSALYWTYSGPGVTAADFVDGQLSGNSLIGSDGSLAFTKAIAADSTVDPNEALAIRFFSDSAHTQQVGTTLNISIKEPTVGTPTDGNDIITGTPAAEFITGVPSSSSLRGQGSIDQLTGAGGNDVFVLADANGIYYDDGSDEDGSLDLAVIKDFTAGDKIQLYGNSANYMLASARYDGKRGIRIDALLTPGDSPEVIGFVQGATLASLNLANSNQFSYV